MVSMSVPTVPSILGNLKVICLRGIELRAGQGIFRYISSVKLIFITIEIFLILFEQYSP